MIRGNNSYILINRDLRVMQIQLSYRDFKEDGWYFAECPELRMMDQGKTKRSAYENLRAMILTTLITAFETDCIDAYLKELGFKQDKLGIPVLNVYKQTIDLPDVIPLSLEAALPPHTGSPTLPVETVTR